MSDALISALDDCLLAVEAGASLEAALARYPDLADELRPLLTAAAAARPAAPLRVPQQSEMASRTRFLARAHALQRERRRAAGFFSRFSLALRMGLAVLAVAAVSGLGAVGLVSASAGSLPGDALYGVKRTAEQVQLAFSTSPAARAALEAEFAQRRLAEAALVSAQGRQVPVQFTGLVEAQAGARWTIAGLTVIVPAGLEAGLTVGQIVEVAGVVAADGAIFAQHISLRGQAVMTAWPSATPTASGTARVVTQTAGPTETAEPGETETADPSDTPRPLPGAATVTPRATVLQPTRTPALGGSGSTPAGPSGTPNSDGPSPSHTPRPSNTAQPGGGSSTSPDSPPTETPQPSETPDDDETEAPEPTHTPGSGGGPSPQPPSETPRPSETPDDDSSQTPEASETPHPEGFDFEGRVEAVGGEAWVIAGQTVALTGETEIRDNPGLGDKVKVSGWRYWDGRLVARRIEKD